MIDYIVKDIIAIARYLPAGVLLGVPLGLVICAFGKKTKPYAKTGMFFWGLCLGFILTVTYFSREIGSAGEVVDLKLFSTWEINTRNRAYLVENILLFLPYGLLYAVAFGRRAVLWNVFVVSFVTSLGIETMQLITKRGIFQVDDVLTNVCGAVVGGLLYLIFRPRKKAKA